jgi:hypothetical protein
MLAARRQQLEQARARAAERLAQAEARLDRLGWRGRRAHRAELRTEIALQRAALRLADQKLAEPIPAPKPERSRAERDPLQLAREHSLGHRRPARETLQRSRGLERERGFGIEL